MRKADSIVVNMCIVHSPKICFCNITLLARAAESLVYIIQRKYNNI